MPDMPTPDVSIECGACGHSLDHDGDDFRCYDCKLVYTGLDATADYEDPEDEPCGHPYGPGKNPLTTTQPFKFENGAPVQWVTIILTHSSCALPAGHPGGTHYFPEDTRYEYSNRDPKETQ